MMVFDGYTPELLSFLTSISLHRIFECPVFSSLVTLCLGLSCVLLGVVMVYVWERPPSGPRERTGFEKVLNGECIQGWRLVLSKSSICKWSNLHRDGYWIVPPWQPSTADANTSSDSMSVFISTVHTRSDGRTLFELRQQSLIIDDIFRVICQLEYRIVWSFRWAIHLTPRVIAIVFTKIPYDHHRVILVDIITRTHRTIMIQRPAGGGHYIRMCGLRQGTVERDTLQAVFARTIEFGNNGWFVTRGKFTVASYKIPSEGEIDTFHVEPQSWKSLPFPVHQTPELLSGGLVSFSPMTFILYHDIEQAGHPIFTLDELNGWRIDSVASWKASLQVSPYIASVSAATEVLRQLSVPSWRIRHFPPSVHDLSDFVWHPVGGTIFYKVSDSTIIQRLIYPPTLKRLAAEALCKSGLPVDHSRLKQLSGVDIFDGMTDEEE